MTRRAEPLVREDLVEKFAKNVAWPTTRFTIDAEFYTDAEKKCANDAIESKGWQSTPWKATVRGEVVFVDKKEQETEDDGYGDYD